MKVVTSRIYIVLPGSYLQYETSLTPAYHLFSPYNKASVKAILNEIKSTKPHFRDTRNLAVAKHTLLVSSENLYTDTIFQDHTDGLVIQRKSLKLKSHV